MLQGPVPTRALNPWDRYTCAGSTPVCGAHLSFFSFFLFFFFPLFFSYVCSLWFSTWNQAHGCSSWCNIWNQAHGCSSWCNIWKQVHVCSSWCNTWKQVRGIYYRLELCFVSNSKLSARVVLSQEGPNSAQVSAPLGGLTSPPEGSHRHQKGSHHH
jgi:hypothetical protein